MAQTAIQEAIKEIVESWSSPGDRPNYTQILNILESKLEIEKEQLIEFYRNGRTHQQQIKVSRFYNQMAKDYYNEIFKSE